MTDRALPSEELANSTIELLIDTPLVAVHREVTCFVRLPLPEQFAVAVLVKAGEADSVQDALDSMAKRDEAHARALERRSRFEVVGDP